MKRLLVLSLLLLSSVVRAELVQNFEAINVPISDFVQWFSMESGRTIVIGKGVDSIVTVNAVGLDSSELSPFFTAVLDAHGLELTKTRDFYTVVLTQAEKFIDEPNEVKVYQLKEVRNTKVAAIVATALKNAKQTVDKDGNKTTSGNSNVQALISSNSIIVSGTAHQIQSVDALINVIDQKQQLVYIESIITETLLDDNKELGVNLSTALDGSGFNFATNVISALNPMSDGHAIYNGGDFNALIKAVSTSENTTLLSKPHILILDREQGYISVGQNVPFLVATDTTDAGKVTQRIERRDVGISLSVVPHIIGNSVILQISQESSSVSNSAIASDIITNKRTVQTTVSVQSGQTISLGGLNLERIKYLYQAYHCLWISPISVSYSNQSKCQRYKKS